MYRLNMFPPVSLGTDEDMVDVETNIGGWTGEEESSEFMNVQLAASLLGKNRVEFRKNSILSRKNAGYWEGNLYRIRNGSLSFLPTNLPRVSYLDLEQHCHIFPQSTQFQINLLLCSSEKMSKAKGHILVDRSSVSLRKFAEEGVAKYIESAHYHIVKYIMDLEYHYWMYEELKAHFNIFRFKRMVDYCLNQRFLGPEIQSKCEMIVRLMATHCRSDSGLIIRVFTNICKRFRMADLVFLYVLPSNLIRFFGDHLRQVNGEFVDVFAQWFRDEDLMIHALYEGSLDKVKKLVYWEYPSGLLPFAMTPSVASLVKGAWPREKDGEPLQSYYSLEYFAVFSTYLITCATLSLRTLARMETLQAGFRTFWRSVPIPHLPFEDMSTCLHSIVEKHPARLPFDMHVLQITLMGMEHLFVNDEEYRFDMYAPRSLRHLCRCAIRRRCPTSEGIAALPVGNLLKPYLCLEK